MRGTNYKLYIQNQKENIDNIEIFKLSEEKKGERREITAVLDNLGQIRENKQEVIDVVYNFYADLYKGQNIFYLQMNV